MSRNRFIALAALLIVVAGTAVSGAARLTCSLSQHYQLPRRAARSHDAFQTPHVAIAVSAARLTAGWP